MTHGSTHLSAIFAAALIVVGIGCSPTTPATPTAPSASPPVPARAPAGALGGTVTINGEARPIVFVALHTWNWNAFATTNPSGSWEWGRVPAGDHVVVIKTPPGLTCDATSKPATVTKDQRTVVNFACVGDVKGSIQGFALNEFGTAASARITLTGPVNRETISNLDGFFAFEDLAPGDYLLGWCKDPVRASVRNGAPAFAMVDCS